MKKYKIVSYYYPNGLKIRYRMRPLLPLNKCVILLGKRMNKIDKC